jgi:hypothetical protein
MSRAAVALTLGVLTLGVVAVGWSASSGCGGCGPSFYAGAPGTAHLTTGRQEVTYVDRHFGARISLEFVLTGDDLAPYETRKC